MSKYFSGKPSHNIDVDAVATHGTMIPLDPLSDLICLREETFYSKKVENFDDED